MVPLGEGVAELNFPSAAPNMLLLGTAPEAIRAPHKKTSPSVEGSDDENDDETDAASTDDAPHNPAGVTPETVAAALGLSNLRADVDGEPTGDVILPNVAGRNSIGDTFAIYPDPAHVLAARPNLKRIAALGGRGLVVTAAGGVATPADAALMMQLGMDGVFVGSGIFKSGEPAKRARAIVQAVTHYNDPKIIAEVSQGLGEAMVGIDCKEMHFTSYAARSE